MPTQTYTDNSRGKVVNIIPKRTIGHAHNPNALKTEKKNLQPTLKDPSKFLIPPKNCLPPQTFSTFQDQWINRFYWFWPPLSKHLQQTFYRKIYQNFRYHEHHIKIKTAWPPWIFRKSPWETTKFLIAQKLGCSGRIRSSCYTRGTRRVTRLKVSTREGIEIKTKEIFRPRDIKEG
jgi:hypothetical protein